MGKCCGQRQVDLLQRGGILYRSEDPERSGGRVDAGEHFGEEGLVFLLGNSAVGMGDKVAERKGRWQMPLLSAQMCLYLLDDQLQRGVVHHQVMVLQAEQPAFGGRVVGQMRLDQRSPLRAGCGGGGVHPCLQVGGRIGSVKAMHTASERGLAPDDLQWRAQALPDKAGAQAIVAGDDLVERIEEGIELFARREAEYGRVQIGIGEWIGQVVEQQAFLQRRQRIDVLHIGHAALDAGDDRIDLRLGQRDQRQQVRGDAGAIGTDAVGRHHEGGCGLQIGGQAPERGLGEQGPYIDLPAEPTQAFDQFDRQQRVAAEGEEVVVASDLFDAEQLAPQRGQHLFEVALRGDIGLQIQRLSIGRGQGGAIELAVGGQRQRLELHVGGRQHVVGKVLGKLETQRCRVRRCGLLIGDHISDQAFVTSVFAGDNHRFFYAIAAAQGRFDLAGLDAEAADLDLRIVAAKEIQASIGQPAGQVAGPVHALTGLLCERIGHEAFGGQVGAMQIALRQLRTGQMQFAGHADWRRLAVAIEHIEPGIGQRPADRHTLLWIGRMLQRQRGDELGALGRTIGLQHGGGAAGVEDLGQRVRICDIAAGEQQTQCAQLRCDCWRIGT